MGRYTQRDRIVRATATLFRKQGYASTGLAEIVSVSGAPKGSLYYYFPEGKDQIAAEAVRYAGSVVEKTLAELCAASESAADAIRAYGELLAGWMAKSRFRDGCPITTTLLETAPQEASISEAGRAAFATWTAVIADRLMEEGALSETANRLARFAVMSLEGALILSRVESSTAPVLDVAQDIAVIFECAARETTK